MDEQIDEMNRTPGDDWLDISLSQVEQQLEEREEKDEFEAQNWAEFFDSIYNVYWTNQL